MASRSFSATGSSERPSAAQEIASAARLDEATSAKCCAPARDSGLDAVRQSKVTNSARDIGRCGSKVVFEALCGESLCEASQCAATN